MWLDARMEPDSTGFSGSVVGSSGLCSGKAVGLMFSDYHGWVLGKEWSSGSVKMEIERLVRRAWKSRSGWLLNMLPYT